MTDAATAGGPHGMLVALGRVADALTRHVAISLGAVVAFQLVATLALFFSINHNGWLTYQGGDQIWLVTSGWLLGKGLVGYAFTSYGWPMLLAPLTWITGSSSIELLPLTTVLQVATQPRSQVKGGPQGGNAPTAATAWFWARSPCRRATCPTSTRAVRPDGGTGGKPGW